MSNPRAACGLLQAFIVVEVSYTLTNCPYFDNLEFDIFDAGGPQCHFITSVTTATRIRTFTLSLKVKLVC